MLFRRTFSSFLELGIFILSLLFLEKTAKKGNPRPFFVLKIASFRRCFPSEQFHTVHVILANVCHFTYTRKHFRFVTERSAVQTCCDSRSRVSGVHMVPFGRIILLYIFMGLYSLLFIKTTAISFESQMGPTLSCLFSILMQT